MTEFLWWLKVFSLVFNIFFCSHIINFPFTGPQFRVCKWITLFISRELCYIILNIVVQNEKKIKSSKIIYGKHQKFRCLNSVTWKYSTIPFKTVSWKPYGWKMIDHTQPRLLLPKVPLPKMTAHWPKGGSCVAPAIKRCPSRRPVGQPGPGRLTRLFHRHRPGLCDASGQGRLLFRIKASARLLDLHCSLSLQDKLYLTVMKNNSI